LTVYVDSSFLVSPYVQDSHSLEFLQRISTHPAIRITPFHSAEVAHAISLHVFCKKLSSGAAARAWSEFLEDCRAEVWVSVDLPEGALAVCSDLGRRYGPTLGVRTLDSLHVACALELRADKFWTFDERQAKLAEVVGLDVTP
jgi:predicted nucleic acid-binding protein